MPIDVYIPTIEEELTEIEKSLKTGEIFNLSESAIELYYNLEDDTSRAKDISTHLLESGYTFVGIQRAKNDEVAKKVKQYKEKGRKIEGVSIASMKIDGFSKITTPLEDVMAYFVN
ncbi:MAG: hypothetical protein IB618_01035 [Candidatus Pacearchaeota archaeon]|nr:MAG: hypothetical protein IB618_01035 [Candidatus Pacearchaeota archaeon]